MSARPYILAIGGTTNPDSLTERILQKSLGYARQQGAETRLLGSQDIQLPPYAYGSGRSGMASTLINEVRRADGLIIASPGYHGGVSGLVKNALDYIEEARTDNRPYLSQRAVGCIGLAGGWQAAVTTMNGLRDIVHALRGWPTPLGVVINSSDLALDNNGEIADSKLNEQLQILAQQVISLCTARPS